MTKSKTKDYRWLIQQVELIIRNWPDSLNPHNSAEKIVNLILSHKSICDHDPTDTKVWVISKVNGFRSYPFKDL